MVFTREVYKDVNTPSPFSEELSALGDDGERQKVALPDHVFLDSPTFGAGVCSVQITMQAQDEAEARILHDQLAVLAPIMMALSAASPIQRGHLVDTDSRWAVVAQSWDERTPEERVQGSAKFVARRRCDSIGTFIAAEDEQFNDKPDDIDEESFNTLIRAGVDPLLAGHVAGIVFRDPLLLLKESRHLHQDDEYPDLGSLQSCMWRTVKLKLPDKSGGWRVELRTMDAQLTDLENAALVNFVLLVSRALLHYRVNIAIPISKLDANVEEAQKRDAVEGGQFFFRSRISPGASGVCSTATNSLKKLPEAGSDLRPESEVKVMSVNDIVNGTADFEGLIPFTKRFLDDQHCDDAAARAISRHLALISSRAAGRSPTPASWMRDFVTSHPEYQKNSQVSDRVTFDLLARCWEISSGKVYDDALIPNDVKRPEF